MFKKINTKIYSFFKKLTSGSLKIEENPNIPFSLFISSYRRKKILDAMMSKTDKDKKDGEHILNNYKKQLAEKMAREKANRGDISMKSSFKGSSRSNNKRNKFDEDDDEKMSRMGPEFGGNEPPEPEILLSIL